MSHLFPAVPRAPPPPSALPAARPLGALGSLGMLHALPRFGAQSWRTYSAAAGAGGPPRAAGVDGAAADAAKTAALRGWAAVRAAPVRHAFTFVGLHVTIAQLALLPAYAVLRSTGLGTSLVAGPQAAYILARPLPDWACASLGIQEATTDAGTRRAPTVEDAVEMGLRRVARGAWAGGGAIFRLVGAFRKGKDDPVAMLQQVGDEYKRGKQQGREEADAAIDDVKQGKSWKQSVGSSLGGRAQKIAGDVKLGQVRDALGAWVIVKMLLPLRIPLSLWLTPRFARGMTRVFTRRG